MRYPLCAERVATMRDATYMDFLVRQLLRLPLERMFKRGQSSLDLHHAERFDGTALLPSEGAEQLAVCFGKVR